MISSLIFSSQDRSGNKIISQSRSLPKDLDHLVKCYYFSLELHTNPVQIWKIAYRSLDAKNLAKIIESCLQAVGIQLPTIKAGMFGYYFGNGETPHCRKRALLFLLHLSASGCDREYLNYVANYFVYWGVAGRGTILCFVDEFVACLEILSLLGIDITEFTLYKYLGNHLSQNRDILSSSH